MSRRSVVPGVAAVVLLSCVAAAQDCLEPVASWRYGVSNDVAAEGSRAVLANGAVVQLLDVTAPSSPSIIGEITLEHMIQAIAIDGSLAYVVSYGYGDLHVIDISGPAPAELGVLTGIGSRYDLAVAAGMVYAIDYESLAIIDATIPSAPVFRGELMWDDGHPFDIDVSSGYAYVAADDVGVRVVDVSEPTSPTEVAHLDLGVSASARRLDIVAGLAFVVGIDTSEFSWRLWVVDLSDPTSPVLVSNSAAGGAQDIVVEDGVATIAGGSDLWTYDVTNPQEPTLLGYTSVPYFPETDQHRLAALHGHSLMTGELHGLGIYDLTDPAAPAHVAAVDVPGRIEDATVADGVVYVAVGDRGLRTVDVTDAAHPSELVLASLIPGVAQPWGVAVVGETAYVASYGPPGLLALDVSDPGSPVVVGNTPGAIGNWVTVGNGYAYVLNGWMGGGISVVSLASPAAPVLVGSSNLGAGQWEWPVVIGDHLVVRNNDNEASVVVVDVGDPTTPEVVATFDVQQNIAGLAASGNWLLVPDIEGWVTPQIRIFDMTDPAVPVEVEAYATVGGAVEAVEVAGSVAYLAVIDWPPDQTGGIEVVNLANPRAPTFMGLIERPRRVKRLAFGPDELYVFDLETGFDSYALCRGPIFADGFESGNTSAWAGVGE